MTPGELPKPLLIGVLLLLGWSIHALAARVHLPRVTLLLAIGVLASPAVFDLAPRETSEWFPDVANFALAMIGFLLGENLVGQQMRRAARTVLYVSIGAAIAPLAIVFIVIYALSGDPVLALLLGGIATATDPAAIFDVIRERHAKGVLARAVLGIVAIDDAWGIILFGVALIAAGAVAGQGGTLDALVHGVREVVGAALLGAALGLPMAWLTGRLRPGEPTLIEAAGFVFVCAGLAQWLSVSYLLACMVLGAMVALWADHHTRPFRAIDGASQPFLVLFFLLAGHSVDLGALASLGWIAFAYVGARTLGKLLGAQAGARFARAPATVQSRIGWCLLPQAGVALGLALLASERFPSRAATILPIVIASTVVFELLGSVLTARQLRLAGELPAGDPREPVEPRGRL